MERSADANTVWSDSIDGSDLSSVGMVQVYTDRTVTALTSNAVVAYPVHVVLSNFTKTFLQFLVYHGYTFSGLLPVYKRMLNKINKRER